MAKSPDPFPLPPVVRRLAPARCTLSAAGHAKRLVHLAQFRFPPCGKYPKESLPKRAILPPALPHGRRRTSLIDTGMITFKNAGPNFTAAFSVRTHNNPKRAQDIVFSYSNDHFIMFVQVGTNEKVF
ncbi:hypothetical protein [uncultured Slackia sp.]|uniref:hypothetical protein n=1 Tax=uncultured Slackia sp. TaxID=665903 RepID=UPI0025E4CC31|nr:hypothetical protein [uncultured Slackia sp.]